MSTHAIDDVYVRTGLELAAVDISEKACHRLLESVQAVAAERVDEFIKRTCLGEWRAAANTDSAIVIYETEAWEQVFDELEIEDDERRKLITSIHSLQSQDLLFASIVQGEDVRHDTIRNGRSWQAPANPYANPLLIENADHFELGRNAMVWDLQYLLQAGLSPAEALDYMATRRRNLSQVDWAETRSVSHQAVSKNVRQAVEKLGQRNPDSSRQRDESERADSDWRPPVADADEERSFDEDFDWTDQVDRTDSPSGSQDERDERFSGESAPTPSSFDEPDWATSGTAEETVTTPANAIDWEAVSGDGPFTAAELEAAWHEMLDEPRRVNDPFIETLTEELGDVAARRIEVTFAEFGTLTESQMEQIAAVVEARL